MIEPKAVAEFRRRYKKRVNTRSEPKDETTYTICHKDMACVIASLLWLRTLIMQGFDINYMIEGRRERLEIMIIKLSDMWNVHDKELLGK